MKKISTKTLVLGAVLTALVILLQLMGTFIRFGTFQVCLVLIPIVIGAAVGGISLGAWLGFVFSMVVLLNGDASPFYAVSPIGTIITVVLKGVLAGGIAGAVYNGCKKLNKYFAVVVSAITCPVVNAGIFLIGCNVFFLDTLKEWGSGMGYDNVFLYMILVLVGANFLFELLFNVILSPIIVRILNMKYMQQMCGTISGMSGLLTLSTEALDAESVTIPFESVKADDSTIKGRFYTFGHHDANTDPHKMVFYVIMNDGTKYCFKDSKQLDVTDQVHNALDKRRVHIIIDGLDLPQPIENGDGFIQSDDDWNVEENDIIV